MQSRDAANVNLDSNTFYSFSDSQCVGLAKHPKHEMLPTAYISSY